MSDCTCDYQFLYDAEKSSHLKSNQMFLNLLRVVWDDKECLSHMNENTFQELYTYAESWGWVDEYHS